MFVKVMKRWRLPAASAGLAVLLAVGQAAGRTFEDAAGRVVDVPARPERIVSLAPSITEILFALGLGEQVVGVTEFSYHPPEAAEKPKVGSFVRLNAERILELEPDLVIGTIDGNKPGLVRLLEDAGVAVYAVNPRSIEGMIRTVARVGDLCGIKARGKEVADGLEKRLQGVLTRVSGAERPRVFMQINIRPIISVNRDTLHHDVIRLAGGVNVTADYKASYPRLALEQVLALQPEVILISSMERGGAFEEARKAWFQWDNLPAVRNGRVHLVESDLVDRPSPRVIQGLELVAELLHPGGGDDFGSLIKDPLGGRGVR
ncbi:MAG: ABC transporter substrate-binding protein [Desulfobacteraceae bacterium]